jgi:hypothetical protein
MPARSFRSCGVAALVTLAMAACASTAVPRSNDDYAALSRVPSLTPTSRVFDAERIRRSGAQTAWDAVRLLVPRHRLQSSRGPSLRTFDARDVRYFESSIRLIIDGHQVRDTDALRAIPAREIVAIHVLSETEAVTYFGPGSGGGAIVVHTKTSFRQR